LILFLVRHGRPAVEPGRPAHEWPLDPAYSDQVRALRARLPVHAAWYSSPEPKALATALELTDDPVEVVDDLREHERRSAEWVDDFGSVIRRAFARPDRSAYDGWEPLADTRRRVLGGVAGIVDVHPTGDVVLVGHGTAWTLLRAALLDEEPDLDWWAGLAMPDVSQYEVAEGRGDMLVP
jgi:broad specificity phosphatase PhoE